MSTEDNKQEIDPFYQKMFDECYNTGVDACSSIVKIFEGSHEPAIKALVPFLLKELEQLKKHI